MTAEPAVGLALLAMSWSRNTVGADSPWLRAAVLPPGLLLGHLVSRSPLFGGGGDRWSPEVLDLLVCTGVPLLLVATAWSVHDGGAGRRSSIRPGAAARQQILAFCVVSLGEHVASGVSPWQLATEHAFWIALAVHALVGVSIAHWLRTAARVGEGLLDGRDLAPPITTRDATATVGRSHEPGRPTPLSPLSRRGPPAFALA